MRLGIDVSDNNGLVNWPEIARAGVTVARIKICQGQHEIDDYGLINVRAAVASKLDVGVYFYGEPSRGSGRADALHAAEVVKQLPIVSSIWLDLEDPAVAPDADLGAYTLDALETITGHTFMPVGLYTSFGYAKSHQVGFSGDLEAYALWLASWSEAEPSSFGDWRAWAGWQFTSEGFWPGAGLCDLSLWQP